LAGGDGLREDEPEAPHSPPAHLLTRVASALVLIPLALAAVWLGGIWFALLLTVGGMAMSVEWAGMISSKRRERIIFMALSLIAALGFLEPSLDAVLEVLKFEGEVPSLLWSASVIGLGVVLLLAGLLARIGRLAWFGTALIYCWTPVYALMWLRAGESGLWMVAWVLLVVWGTDIGGYFVGRTAGGAKLVPHISPNKTWSGLAGAAALAAVVGGIAAHWFSFPAPMLLAAGAALLAVIAQTGDIAESAVKRHFGVKDSGRLIPGHGGVLDRVDGLVFAAPAVAAAVAIVRAM